MPGGLRGKDGEAWVVQLYMVVPNPQPAVPSSLLVAKISKVPAVAPKPLKQVTVMPECHKL